VLCRGFTGEGLVVVKPLPRDCLVRPRGAGSPLEVGPDRELHAHVRERLLRVREIADLNVANLCAVEEDAALGPMLIWQYVPGADLSESPIDREGGGVMKLARDLAATVEKLHLLGIVHGRLHLRNVIVTPGGQLVLTHISPLVVDDTGRDAVELMRMLRELNARPRPPGERRGENAALSRVLAESAAAPRLEELRERLLLAGGTRFVTASATTAARASRSKLWAWALVLAGVAVGAAVLAVVSGLGGGGGGG